MAHPENVVEVSIIHPRADNGTILSPRRQVAVNGTRNGIYDQLTKTLLYSADLMAHFEQEIQKRKRFEYACLWYTKGRG